MAFGGAQRKSAFVYGTEQRDAIAAVRLWTLHSIPLGRAVIQKLVAQVGGTLAAAVALGVLQAAVERYVDGSRPVPNVLLMRAVDLIVDEYLEPYARNQHGARVPAAVSAVPR